MPNPVNMAMDNFWKTTREFDKIAKHTNANVPSLTEDFKSVQQVDTDQIRKIANELWMDVDTESSLKHAVERAVQKINDTRTYISEGWDGEDFIAFDRQLTRVRDLVDSLGNPAEEIGKSLDDLATKMEQTLSDTMKTVAVFGGVINAIGGILLLLATLPEPVVSKALAVVVAIIGFIVAAVALLSAVIKSIEDRQKAADAVINECFSLVKQIKTS